MYVCRGTISCLPTKKLSFRNLLGLVVKCGTNDLGISRKTIKQYYNLNIYSKEHVTSKCKIPNCV